MTVKLNKYVMFSLEMRVEDGYLKNLTGATLSPLDNILRATAQSAKRLLPTATLSVRQSV